MIVCVVFLLILFNISQHQCKIPSCKTNCTTNEDCWREVLAYHSSELVEQLFSFSSLAVHVDRYQRIHTSEVNDSILFIGEALENQLSNELIDTNLTKNLFDKSNKILIDLCTNLTLTEIDTVSKIPSLTCSLSTCSSETKNSMVIFVISILIASSILLLGIMQSLQTYRQGKRSKIFERPVSFVNPFTASDPSINFHSNRF